MALPEVARRRRAAVVLDDLGVGSAQRAAIEQAACLDPVRWDVEVASLELRPTRGWEQPVPRCVPVRRPGLTGLTGWLRAFRPDVVHAHSARSTIACSIAASLVGCRVVVSTCHSLSDWQERRRHPVRLLTRVALHRCHTVLAVSEAVRRAIALHDGALGVRTIVLRNGTDLSAFAAVRGMRAAAREFLGYRHGSFVVGAVARLVPRKGLDVLLSAASEALARVPGLEVLIVGDGSERARLMAQSNELGLSSRVRFVGEQRDVRPYLAALDLFVAPSRNEGLGIALVEALASGVPVAGAAVGGIAEVLANGSAGWLLPPEVTAWANAIVRAARTPGELERMSEAGLERAAAFSIERTRDRLAAIYERALGEAGHRGLEAA